MKITTTTQLLGGVVKSKISPTTSSFNQIEVTGLIKPCTVPTVKKKYSDIFTSFHLAQPEILTVGREGDSKQQESQGARPSHGHSHAES